MQRGFPGGGEEFEAVAQASAGRSSGRLVDDMAERCCREERVLAAWEMGLEVLVWWSTTIEGLRMSFWGCWLVRSEARNVGVAKVRGRSLDGPLGNRTGGQTGWEGGR